MSFCSSVVLLLRPSLKGTQFKHRDHNALRCILNNANVSGKLVRWRLCLYEFEFNVVHRTGVKHQVANSLLRLWTHKHDTTKLNNALLVLTIVAVGKAKDDKCTI